jgi:hypothetical protein
MPGEEGGKVRGNHKEKKGKGCGGAPNPLAAIRGPVLIPKTSAGAETKGASHTQASDTKGASHTQASDSKGSSHTQLSIPKNDRKGASHTQVSGPMKDAKVASATQGQKNKAGKKGTSHTQANDEAKGAQAKEVDNLSGSAERALEEERIKAQIAKELTSKTMSYLARELSSIGDPLLSDTMDANHLACYLALDAERGSLSERTRKEDCVFTVIEMWQQCVEMVRQSGGDNKQYAALAEEEWQLQQYRDLFRKRSERAAAEDTEQTRTCAEVVKHWLTVAAQRLQAIKNLEGVSLEIMSLLLQRKSQQRQAALGRSMRTPENNGSRNAMTRWMKKSWSKDYSDRE